MSQDIKCSYFQNTPCRLCSATPSLIKNGLCALCTTGDPESKNDWIDCYEGCVKHDPNARKVEIETRRSKQEKVLSKKRVIAKYPPVPTASVLAHKVADIKSSDRTYHAKALAGGLCSALEARGISQLKAARVASVAPSSMSEWLGGSNTRMPFYVVAILLKYMRDFDRSQESKESEHE